MKIVITSYLGCSYRKPHRKDQTPGALEVGDHALQLVVRESGQGGWNALKEDVRTLSDLLRRGVVTQSPARDGTLADGDNVTGRVAAAMSFAWCVVKITSDRVCQIMSAALQRGQKTSEGAT